MRQRGTPMWVWVGLAALGLSSCTALSTLADRRAQGDAPYGKETQMAYFEAQTHLLKGDLQDAYTQLMTCVEAEPDEHAFHYQLGKIDLDLERYDAAEERLTRAAELAPGNTWVLYHRGLARLAQGNGAGAEQDFTPFVVNRPGDLEALFECADLLLSEGHILPTLNLLDHYESQVGRDEDVRLEALRIVEQTADPKSLGQFLDRALRDFPDSDILQLQLARWFMATEDLNAAEQELNALLERRPDWGLVHFELAELVTRKGRTPDALPHLRKAMASDDVAVERKVRVLLGYGLFAQEDEAFAAAYDALLDVMMSRHGDEPGVVELACDWAYQHNRLDEARGLAEDLLLLAPSSVESWTNLLAILVDLSAWSDMADRAGLAVERFPLNPLLHYYHGLGLRESKRSALAADAYRAGLAVVLDNPVLEGALASALASALRDLKAFDDSEAAFERSLKAIEDAFVLNNHAYYLAGRHSMPQGRAKLERALECSQRANELRPGEGNFMDTQAYVLFKLGRFDEALSWILDAQTHGMETDAVALEHEGDIRWALEDRAGARQAWQRALDAGGDPDVLTPKLNRP